MARILLIDDDEFVRSTVERYLVRAGHQVVTAGDGAIGLRAFAAEPFQLVITDILMPEKEGIETILELRRARPEIRIIAISGGSRTQNVDYLEIARKLGADLTIAKPFRAEQLIAAIDGLLGRGAS